MRHALLPGTGKNVVQRQVRHVHAEAVHVELGHPAPDRRRHAVAEGPVRIVYLGGVYPAGDPVAVFEAAVVHAIFPAVPIALEIAVPGTGAVGAEADEIIRVLGQQLRIERSVVHDKIHYNFQTGLVRLFHEVPEIFLGTQVRVDRSVIAYGIRRTAACACLSPHPYGKDAHGPHRVEAHALYDVEVRRLEVAEEKGFGGIGRGFKALRPAAAVEVIGAREKLVDAGFLGPRRAVILFHIGLQAGDIILEHGVQAGVLLAGRQLRIFKVRKRRPQFACPGHGLEKHVEIKEIIVELAGECRRAVFSFQLFFRPKETLQPHALGLGRPTFAGVFEHEMADLRRGAVPPTGGQDFFHLPEKIRVSVARVAVGDPRQRETPVKQRGGAAALRFKGRRECPRRQGQKQQAERA